MEKSEFVLTSNMNNWTVFKLNNPQILMSNKTQMSNRNMIRTVFPEIKGSTNKMISQQLSGLG